jgi:hypothetical protein
MLRECGMKTGADTIFSCSRPVSCIIKESIVSNGSANMHSVLISREPADCYPRLAPVLVVS